MPFISNFLSYFGAISLLYHASIGIFLKQNRIQHYRSYPTPVNDYSFLLMKWLCFMVYLFFEDVLLVIFEIIPLGSWLLLVFKIYFISPRSEVHLKLFRTVFKYIEFQDELLNISFYGSLASKTMILGFTKLNIKLLKCLSPQHLEETEYVFVDFMTSMRAIKARAITKQQEAPLNIKDVGPKPDFIQKNVEEIPLVIAEKIERAAEERPTKKEEIDGEVEGKVRKVEVKIKEKRENTEPADENYEAILKKADEANEKVKEKIDLAEPKAADKKPKKVVSSPVKDKKAVAGKKPKVEVKKPAKKPEAASEKPEKEPKDKEENKEAPKERKRFIEAGVFEADVSVQTKEGSKLNPDLYQDFKALIVLPEKTFILKNLTDGSEFIRKPLKELKMISNVTLLIKVVYFTEEEDKSGGAITGSYSMKLKCKADYEEWFLPVSLFVHRDQL